MRRTELEEKWELKAAELRSLSASVDGAAMCQLFIADLHALAAENEDAWVSIAEAAALSGYSQQHIRRLIHSRQLEVDGEGKRRRVRLNSLPRKPSLLPTVKRELHVIAATAEQAVRESVGAS